MGVILSDGTQSIKMYPNSYSPEAETITIANAFYRICTAKGINPQQNVAFFYCNNSNNIFRCVIIPHTVTYPFRFYTKDYLYDLFPTGDPVKYTSTEYYNYYYGLVYFDTSWSYDYYALDGSRSSALRSSPMLDADSNLCYIDEKAVWYWGTSLLQNNSYFFSPSDGIEILVDEQGLQTHTYHAIPSLTNGSQAFALTTISDTYIGETATTFPVEAITSWSVQSKFNDYLINKKESGRYSKMFELSADKYIGLSITNYSDIGHESWIGEVRFYNNGTYDSTLSFPFTVNNYGGEINAYLTLALDSENHCIKPTVVRKVANTLVFNDETYTDAQQEALYNYLSSFIGSETGGAGNTPTSDGESGGGGGWYMPDDIDGVPSLPQVSVIDGGMVSLYKLTSGQLDGLADYLWSDDFLDNIKKFFNDPMEMIISLRAYPFTVSAGIDTTIKAGNITTTVHGDKLTGSTQFARIDCGEVTVFPRTKTYRDYSPYTSASIFLPFVGTRPIDIDLIVDKRVGVQYNVDLFSGQAICFVTINGNVMYQYECSLGCSIPISSQSYSNIMGSVTSALTIPFNPVGGVTGISEGFRPAISRSGSFSGYGGMLGSLKPKIYFEYAQFIEAKNQEEEYGKPSHKRIKLDNCDGYTEVDEIHLDGTTALADEVDELYKILKGGFIA